MQRIIQANWQQQLIHTILKGQFLMSPEIAMGYGAHIADLLAKTQIYSNTLSALDNIDIKTYSHQGEQENPQDQNNPKEHTVAVLPIKGTMLKYGTRCTYGMDEIAHYAKHFANKDQVAAIVLDIDSGGGAINAIPPILEAISHIRNLKKPIIAHCDSACSAAYWAASGCDHIFVNNDLSASFGSIGVMITYLDMIPYYVAKGAKFHEIYADPSAEKNLPFQKMLAGEYDQIKQEILNPIALKFQQAVKINRINKIKVDSPGILSGYTYDGQQAIANGLADQIGNLQAAIDYATAQAWART